MEFFVYEYSGDCNDVFILSGTSWEGAKAAAHTSAEEFGKRCYVANEDGHVKYIVDPGKPGHDYSEGEFDGE